MMNKIVASRINLLAMSLNCGLPKKSSSHIESELKVYKTFACILFQFEIKKISFLAVSSITIPLIIT